MFVTDPHQKVVRITLTSCILYKACKVVQPCDGKGDSSQPPTNSKTLRHEPKSQAILWDIGLKYGKFAGKGDTCQALHYQPAASSWAPTFSILEEGSECLL